MAFLYRLDFSSGKSYVGVTTRTPQSRLILHRYWAGHGKKLPIYSAWRKHGEPKLVVLAQVERCDIMETERRAIRVFGTLVPGGYNMTSGGQLSPTSDPKVRAKIAASMTGRPVSAETRLKLSLSLKAYVERKRREEIDSRAARK